MSSEREVEVRTLGSESTRIHVSRNTTVQDLKQSLNRSFAPASSSANFHLFLKGVKLDLQGEFLFDGEKMTVRCKQNNYPIDSGDFMVLIPFAKKERPQQSGQSKTSPGVSGHTSISTLADSAWTDMMKDLSSLCDSSGDMEPNIQSQGCRSGDGNGMSEGNSSKSSVQKNRKRKINDEECLDNDLLSIIQSGSHNVLDEKHRDKFIKYLESENCLSFPYSRNCWLLGEARFAGLHDSYSMTCLCPVWLKTTLKAFAFLNVYVTSVNFQGEELSLTCLKEALNQLRQIGVQVGIKDIEHLSILCPKVVCLSNNGIVDSPLHDTLIIIKSSEQSVQASDKRRNARKRTTVSRIIGLMEKRKNFFRKTLREGVKMLMLKDGNKFGTLFSMEDLLSVSKANSLGSGNQESCARRSWSSHSNSPAVRPRCCETNSLHPMEMVEHLKKGLGSYGQLVHLEDIGARTAKLVDIPHELSDKTKLALESIGVYKLYCHQAESIQASLAGKNIVVATMTSSGKSLCYNLPVLEVLSQSLSSCALYLFPTKALAQDQLRALMVMTQAYNINFNMGIYDGDTSQEDRKWLRENARLLITNPDMLHMSILPFHQQFRRILSNLRFVVVDEAHSYKGAFGCHTAFILRRLRRICSHAYGSDPNFVFSTATSANPREHCMELANLPTLELVKNDGSPSSQKLFILWNPTADPMTAPNNTQTGMASLNSSDIKDFEKRPSSISEVAFLFAEMVQHGLRCLAFCKSRKLCEVILCYTREILQDTAPHLVDSIFSYRGGYIAEDRRKIESDLFSGKLCGVVTTNALELGIDVGHIDVTLHLGFPGSIASLWQQAGRSGRRERPSLAVYIAFGGPLDQYFMKFPEKLFRGTIECCHIDAQNPQVLEQHLACAAIEHPICLEYDEKYFGHGLNSAIKSLQKRRQLSCNASASSFLRMWSYIGQEKTPSRAVSIRAIENERYKVISKQHGEVLEEIEESRAFFQVYEGAVYMHQGNSYLVKELDIQSKNALCQKANVDYYTRTRDYTDIHVVGGSIAYPPQIPNIQYPKTTAQAHACKVTTTWFGFYKIQKRSNRVLDTVELSLPKYSYDSQAVWIRVSQSVKEAVEKQNLCFRAGLHAASHALKNVVPLCVVCNSSDLAPECPNPYDTRYFPERILLYDQHPGGTGVSIQVRPHFTKLLCAALDLLTSCCCSGDAGCPNCVQSLNCQEYNEVLHKDAAIMIVKGVLDAEKSQFGEI